MIPIRPKIHALTQIDKDEDSLTLRDLMEWYKKSVRAMSGDSLSAEEFKELNQRWVGLCDIIAKREDVPTGSLSYFLGELANAEIKLVETASQEANEAGITYESE